MQPCGTSGAVSCDNGAPISLYAGSGGRYTFRLDMSAWTAVSAVMDLNSPTGYWFNLGNSRTNNGWSGDGSTNTNDSEANAYNQGMHLYRSDFGGSTNALSTPALVPSQDVATATACDGPARHDGGRSLPVPLLHRAHLHLRPRGDDPRGPAPPRGGGR